MCVKLFEKFCEIKTCLSSSQFKKSDQLLLDGFRYRGDRLVCRCVKASCKGRARLDGINFKIYKGHICQVPGPNVIKKKVAQYHDLPRLINLTRVSHALKCPRSSAGVQMSRAQTSWNYPYVLCSMSLTEVKRIAIYIVLSVSSSSLFMPS